MAPFLFGCARIRLRLERQSRFRLKPVYGGSRRSPRNDTLRTPPGPEGSNGSNGLVCRGAAGVGRHLIAVISVISNRVISPFLG